MADITETVPSEMLPCPFCGGEAAAPIPANRKSTERLYPIVRCMKCFTDVPGKTDDFSLNCGTAITAWDTRARNAEPAAYWAVHSLTGSHIGLWKDEAYARNVLKEYVGGTITPLYAAPMPAVPDGLKQALIARAREDGPLFIEDIEDAFATFTPPAPQAETAPGVARIATDWEVRNLIEKAGRGFMTGSIGDEGEPEWVERIVGLILSKAKGSSVSLTETAQDAVGLIRIIEQSETVDGGYALTLQLDDTDTTVIARFDGRQPVQVDEAMRQRAINAHWQELGWPDPTAHTNRDLEKAMCSALTAAVGGGE